MRFMKYIEVEIDRNRKIISKRHVAIRDRLIGRIEDAEPVWNGLTQVLCCRVYTAHQAYLVEGSLNGVMRDLEGDPPDRNPR